MLKNITKTFCLLTLSISASGIYALQPLDEHSLSNTSAQDGVTIQFDTNISMKRLIWIDNDGLQPINGKDYGISTPQQGMLILGDVTNPLKIHGGKTIIKVDSDGGANAADAFINVNIELPESLEIQTGDIYIAQRGPASSAIVQNKIMNNMTIYLAGMKMNFQLGNSPQGDLAKVYGQIDNGIRVTNIGVLDSNNQYIASMDEFKITNIGDASKFTFDGTGVNITESGIVVTPSSNKMMDVSMNNFRIGGMNAKSMGEMFISGLNIGNNMLTIAGH